MFDKDFCILIGKALEYVHIFEKILILCLHGNIICLRKQVYEFYNINIMKMEPIQKGANYLTKNKHNCRIQKGKWELLSSVKNEKILCGTLNTVIINLLHYWSYSFLQRLEF